MKKTRQQIEVAANIIRQGGVVAYPTESCFGLGCDPNNTEAIRRILGLKKRSRKKGLILIADRFARLQRYIKPLPSDIQDRLSKTWPGPYTWLCPAAPGVSKWIRGDYESIAVRVTAHPHAASLCRHAETCLVSTSANVATRPALTTADAVEKEFGSQIDYIVDLAIGRDKKPSTIQDAYTAEVIRG